MEEKNPGLVLLEQEVALREEFLSKIKEIRKKRLEAETPRDYVKSKPIGGRDMLYVPATYMDNEFKNSSPLYKNDFAFPPFVFQNWIIVGVKLTDMLGNTELGLKAHRIQFNADKKKAVQSGQMDIGQLTPFDMIDVGNDVSACLTEAIKNAQSRFGIAADIYNKQILSPEQLEELEKDFKMYLDTIQNPVKKSKIVQEWKECKTPADKLLYLNELTGVN